MDDPSTQAAMMRVSRRMYEFAAPRLYCEVAIHAKNLYRLHVGASEENAAESGAERKFHHDDQDTATIPTSGTIPNMIGDHTTSLDKGTRMPKTKLLRLVRHLDIYDVPNTYRCKGLLSLAEDKGLPRLLAPTTVSFRPIATWRLMLHSMESERTAFSLPHPVLVYLKVLGIQHLCIQMPILDQQAEDSLAPMRNRNPRNYQDIASIRTRLRDGMLRPGDFYGFLLLQCPNMTIHNLTLLSTNRLFLRLTESTTNVRIFYRPCCGADGEVFDKISDHYCYNHSESAHHITPSLKVLSATQNAQFIDMDWVRGKYDPLRKNKPMELVTDDYSRKGGQKSFKMSSEVEACRCGGKHQLSAVKSLISYVASK